MMTSRPLSSEALRARALALLAGRELSRQELEQKLQGGEPELVQALLDQLQQCAWQDDKRVAELELRAAQQRGHGPLRLRQRLQQRGLAAELISATLAAWDMESADPRALLRARFAGVDAHDVRKRARMMRFLQYRGYSQGQAHALVRSFFLVDDSSS